MVRGGIGAQHAPRFPCRRHPSVELHGRARNAESEGHQPSRRSCHAAVRRIVASGASITALVALPRAAQAEPLADVPVTYAAPDGCPQIEDFRHELAARLVDTSPEAWHGFAFWVSVLGEDAGYVARLRVIDPKGDDIDREVRDPQCQQVVRAVAFVAAVLVDPNAASSAPAPEPAVPPASGALPPVPSASGPPAAPALPPTQPATAPPAVPPPATALSPVVSEPAPPSWVGLATLGLTAHRAVAEGAGFGPRFGLGFRYGSRWGAAGHLSVTRTQSGQVQRDVGSAELTWIAARTDLCLAYRPHPSVDLLPCLLVEVGELRGEGTDTDSRTDRAALWLAPGGLGRAVVRLVDPVGAYVEAGAVAPIIRPHFYFSGPDGQETVYRVPGQGLFAGVGLALEFP